MCTLREVQYILPFWGDQKTMFRKDTYYGTHKHHFTTHIPHYEHIQDIPNHTRHTRHKISTHNNDMTFKTVNNFESSSLCPRNHINCKSNWYIFLLSTSWFIKKISIRLKLQIQNSKSECQYPNIEIWKSVPTSFPCPVPQQGTSCHLPVACSML